MGPSLAVPFAPHGTQLRAEPKGPRESQANGGGGCSIPPLLVRRSYSSPSCARIPSSHCCSVRLSSSTTRDPSATRAAREEKTPCLSSSPAFSCAPRQSKKKRKEHAMRLHRFKIAMASKNQGQPKERFCPIWPSDHSGHQSGRGTGGNEDPGRGMEKPRLGAWNCLAGPCDQGGPWRRGGGDVIGCEVASVRKCPSAVARIGGTFHG